MIRRKRLPTRLAAIAVLLALTPALGAAEQNRRITFDHNCYTVDGADIYIYNGSIHYMRCPKEHWADRLLKLKRAGLNTVQTIVPWNYHEQLPGRLDLTELEDWLTLCQSMGFYVIIRPGPYICGEWDNGGFPDWLVPRGIRLRSDDPDYLQCVEEWYDKVLPVIRRHLATQGGCVLMVQLENEFGGGAEFKRDVIRQMFRMVRERGVDAPLFTCNTPYAEDNEDPIMSQINNGWDVAWCRWETRESKVGRRLRETRAAEWNMPTLAGDIPGGGGIWASYARLPDTGNWRVPPLDRRDYNVVAKTVWMEGAAASNYYVVFGGANYGYWGASYMSTSYWNRPPVKCPLDEPGGLSDSYYTVKRLGQWLQTFGLRQVRSTPFGEAEALLSGDGIIPPLVVEKVHGDALFLFVREEEDRDQKIRVRYTDPMSGDRMTIPRTGHIRLPARDMQILVGNIPLSESLLKYSTSEILGVGKCGDRTLVVLYGPAGGGGELQMQCDRRPRVAGDAQYQWDDSARTLTVNYRYGDRELDLLVGDVQFLVVSRRIARTTWDMPLGDEKRLLVSNCYFLRDCRRLNDGLSFTVETLPGPARAVIPMERRPTSVTRNGRPTPFEWDERARTVSLDFETPRLPKVAIDFDHARFAPDAAGPAAAGTRLDQLASLEELGAFKKGYVRYEAEFPSIGARSMTVRFFEGSSKSGRSHQTVGDPTMVFVNGRYVREASGWHPRKIRFDAADYLRAGRNRIEVLLEKIGRPCGAGGWGMGEPKGLASVSLEGGAGNDRWMSVIKDWRFHTGLRGQEAGCFKKDYDDGHWREVPLGDWKKTAPGAELLDGVGWYRLEFAPTLPVGWTIPLKLRLKVQTDALIYLNGVIIGRYNGVGWQREFHLPECWLDLRGRNVIALAVRNAGGPGGLMEASIRPYEEYSVRSSTVRIFTQAGASPRR